VKKWSTQSFLLCLLVILPSPVFAAGQNASSTPPLPLVMPRGEVLGTTTPAAQISQPAAASSLPPAAVKAAEAFTLTFKNQTFKVPPDVFASWQGQQETSQSKILNLEPDNFIISLFSAVGQAGSPKNLNSTAGYRLDLIYDYIQSLSEKINVPVIEPVLAIQNNRAINFTPPQPGETLDVYQSAFNALVALENGQKSAALQVDETYPKTQLGDLNSLGINQLIGEGVSGFAGSPKNRRHNIAVGITKFQGVLIAPGQTFSFDDDLGPVTADAGFLPELVIKGSQGTIPELGGGLCQVSTTTFRAAMAAGLPITDRRNHAYAVSYYSPQGTDATIYPGSADLKFINNTPGTILIWPYEKDSNTLVFDFYGTSDNRQVTLEKPVVYDRQSDGSMKATWTRLVIKDGITSTSTFKSVYQSPALFHKTETFVSATGTPISGLKIPAGKVQ
jgi:vancomycin resistance protein YoaR